ncbi:MAG TPA: TetR family transcriptional regulator [Gaiellaceae bacterium]|nr:TetR family transcriptional regulator [Gaiellaceae bacterium]
MGLREAKKASTRDAIAGAAMGMFVTRGFDHVTVAEIAHAANVSEKTVFNYFPTKEDIFFDEVPAQLEELVQAIRNREPGQRVLDVLHGLQAGKIERMTRPGFERFARALDESPALRAKELEVMAHFTDVLAGVLRSELKLPAAEAQTAANLLFTVQWQHFRNARAEALAGRSGAAAARRLRADLDRAYRLLERGLGELS